MAHLLTCLVLEAVDRDDSTRGTATELLDAVAFRAERRTAMFRKIAEGVVWATVWFLSHEYVDARVST